MKAMQIRVLAAIAGVEVLSTAMCVQASNFDEAAGRALDFSRRSQHAEAAYVYRQALALAAEDIQRTAMELGLGLNLARMGAWAEARPKLEALLKRGDLTGSQRITAWEGLGDGAMRARDFITAAVFYRGMEAVEGADAGTRARALTKAARAHFNAGDFAAARAAYREVLAIPHIGGPHLHAAFPGIGATYAAEGRTAEARAAYREALEDDRADDRVRMLARIGIGDAAFEEQDYPAALEAYLGIVEEGMPHFVRDRYALRMIERLDTIFRRQIEKAQAMLDAGDPVAARAEFAKVFDMRRSEPHHHGRAQLGVGNSYAAERLFADARAAYTKVLDLPGAHTPDRGRAQMSIARCFEAEGNPEKARQAYAALLEMENVSRFDRAAAKKALE